MSYWEAVLLGIVQGLTEFLPVSSSGHLVIGQHLLHFQGPNLAFDIVLHLGTLLAVIVYFRGEILRILGAFAPGGERAWRRAGLLVLLGTVPTGAIGVLFKDPLEGLFASVRLVAVMLAVTGCLLFAADRVRHAQRPLLGIRAWDAFLVGIVQGLAIIPGISRSGSTIAAGLFLGVEGEAAARFSFLLSIPAILGAVVLEGKEILGQGVEGSGPVFAAGFLAAALSGWLAIGVLLRVLRRKRLTAFALYCWALAVLTLVLLR